jgi:hypothetical protein
MNVWLIIERFPVRSHLIEAAGTDHNRDVNFRYVIYVAHALLRTKRIFFAEG